MIFNYEYTLPEAKFMRAINAVVLDVHAGILHDDGIRKNISGYQKESICMLILLFT